MKFTEFLACGLFTFAEKPLDFELLGFEDLKHLVLFDNIDDLKEKIKFYFKHKNILKDISNNGYEFVRNNHNNLVRGKYFIETLKKEFNIK